jgi:hypothetical protein
VWTAQIGSECFAFQAPERGSGWGKLSRGLEPATAGGGGEGRREGEGDRGGRETSAACDRSCARLAQASTCEGVLYPEAYPLSDPEPEHRRDGPPVLRFVPTGE